VFSENSQNIKVPQIFPLVKMLRYRHEFFQLPAAAMIENVCVECSRTKQTATGVNYTV
jgi:hypothetical protein